MGDPLEIIPAERRESARAALRAALGGSAIDGMSPVTGGASGALTYRVEAGGRASLLRVEPTERGGLRDPARGFACMQAAAEAGIAPALHHADPANGIAVMDFVTERPLADYPGGAQAIVQDLGGLVGKLQATSGFPALADFPVIIARMLGYVRSAGLFAPGLLDAHAAAFERIREAYPWESEKLVSSHNDPNPRNIIYDGQRLWLIDWEASYRNDPLVDVAIIANEFATTPALEDALLHAWLGAEPTRLLRARLTLMRQLARFYYPMLGFSIAVSVPRTAPITDLAAMTEADFNAAVADGRLAPGSPEAVQALCKMMLAAFLAGDASPEVADALAIARQG